MHSIKHLRLPHFHHRTKHDVDMTQGSILVHLIKFAFPLFLGNVFQQMYNMVDTWVVGNYVSNEAYSAVGSVSPIINTLIGFFTGISSGVGAVISQFYGAKKEDRVQDAVHTAVVMTVILGLVFTGVGIFITPYMLQLTKTPAEVFGYSKAYLGIYFAGILGLMIYNIGAGILRAVGDSKRPFYFLVITAVVNTILDLVFVLAFDMGVVGVALATILAQAISALLVMITLMRSQSCIRFSIRRARIHWDVLKKVIGVGLPAGLQLSLTSFSNVFVQSYINYFGADFMAGWTSYTKIDQLAILPVQSISLAATTFVGQNLGCGQEKRAQKGLGTALLLAVGCACILLTPIMIFAPHLVAFFNGKAEVVMYGSLLLRLISPFYIFFCINQVMAGALRGAGNARSVMFILLPCFVVFRQIYLFIMANYISNEVIPISLSYPAGWILASILLGIYYSKVRFSGYKKIVGE